MEVLSYRKLKKKTFYLYCRGDGELFVFIISEFLFSLSLK